MNRNHILLFAAVAVVLAGCSSVPTKDIKVEADSDPKANFGGYKSYAWLGAATIINDPHGQWEPPEFDADAEIKFLIDRELRKRGMVQDSVDPDLVVAFAAGVNMEALDLKVEPEADIDTMENVPQGALLVVLIDSQTGFVIWAGLATSEVQESTDMKIAKGRLKYAVTQLFKKLPK
ncbi:MAG: DUF4136 domain-containing protein [Planctomycetota bacterium]|jgi:hypothetical protein